MGVWSEIKSMFGANEGTCTNTSDREIFVCVNDPGGPQRLETLGPGQSTPPGVDCDGIIFPDGSAEKEFGFLGRTGWSVIDKRTPEWVRDNWPNCAQAIRETNNKIDNGLYTPHPSGSRVISVQVHCQGLGDSAELSDGWYLGTRGRTLRCEGFQINVLQPGEVGVVYMAHLEARGDTHWVHHGQFIGTRGERRKLTGFAIGLNGGFDRYDIYYAAHTEIGTTSWAKNGEFCGTRGYSGPSPAGVSPLRPTDDHLANFERSVQPHQSSGRRPTQKRVEGIMVVLVPLGAPPPSAVPADGARGGPITRPAPTAAAFDAADFNVG